MSTTGSAAARAAGGGHRFVFFDESGVRTVDPRLRMPGWTAPAGGADPSARVRWRLIGPNQRFAGKAVTPSPGLRAALTAVAVLQATLGDHSDQVVALGPGRWVWLLSDRGGTVVAEATRAFHRRVDCLRSLRVFLDAVPVAGHDPSVRLPGRRQVPRPPLPAAAPGRPPGPTGTPPLDAGEENGV